MSRDWVISLVFNGTYNGNYHIWMKSNRQIVHGEDRNRCSCHKGGDAFTASDCYELLLYMSEVTTMRIAHNWIEDGFR